MAATSRLAPLPFNAHRFTGCGTALITPFAGAEKKLDEAAFRKLVKRQVEAGIDFLVPSGTTGESPTLSLAEMVRLVEITREEADGRAAVLAGAGSADTAKAADFAAQLVAAGAEGILTVTPYYNKPPQEGVYQHYRAVAAAVPHTPVFLYSVQYRTAVNIEPATVERLAAIENIAGIKEASGSIGQMAAVAHRSPANFVLLAGDDSTTIPLAALGGRGIISVAANEVPAEMGALARAARDGDFATARQVQRRLFELLEANFIEPNPIPVKQALAELGLCEPNWRLPLVPPRPETCARIRALLSGLGLLPPIGEGA